MTYKNIFLSNSDSGGGIAFNVFKLEEEFNGKGMNSDVLIVNRYFFVSIKKIILEKDTVTIYSTSAKSLIISCVSYLFRALLRKKTNIAQIIYHPRFCDPSVSFFRKLLQIAVSYLPNQNIYYYSDEAARASKICDFNNIEKDNIIGLASMYEKINSLPLSENLKAKISSYDLHICTVGRLVDFKLGYMISLIKLAKRKPNILLTIIGYGPLESVIETEIYNCDNIIFLGEKNLSESKSIVKNSDIYVGMGTTLVDAKSLGIDTVVAIESSNQGLTTGYFGDVDSVHYGEYVKGYDYYDLETFLSNIISSGNNNHLLNKSIIIKNPWDKLIDSKSKMIKLKKRKVFGALIMLVLAFIIRPFIKNDYQ